MQKLLFPLFIILALVAAGCASNTPPSTSTPPTSTTSGTPSGAGLHADLLGDGSTFVQPLADKWRAAFTQANGGVTMSYTGGGSGKGKSDLAKGLVDFAGSDSPMSDAELANASDVIELPAAAGAVTIAYNVPEAGSAPLKFDGAAIAAIFLGKITKWNDPALQQLNPGVALPDQPIGVVHRSDGSGTTATFTDYLVKVSPDWKAGPGKGTTVNWPTGTGAPGNNGVGSQIQHLPYSIGYLGAEWASISAVQTGLVKNKAGNFEAPTTQTVAAAVDAAASAGAFDAKLRGSVTDQACDNCYPIALVTWLMAHQHQGDAAKGQALAAFLWYAIHDGQQTNPTINYVPIPASLVAKEEALVNGMVGANGQKLR